MAQIIQIVWESFRQVSGTTFSVHKKYTLCVNAQKRTVSMKVSSVFCTFVRVHMTMRQSNGHLIKDISG